MKPFNVTLIQPASYVHAAALKEAADYIHTSLIACGCRAARTANTLGRNSINIVLGAHMLDPLTAAKIPVDSIIFNTEPLADAAGWHFKGGAYRDLLARCFVWDYSLNNLEQIAHENKALVPFLFAEPLRRKDLPRTPGDSLLFYGVITPWRQRLLDELERHQVPVRTLFGVYEDARDRQMMGAWAVLNLHKHAGGVAFEPIRCFYPLINQVPVISEDVDDETAQPFRDSMFFFKAETLAASVAAERRDAAGFARRSREQLERFRAKSACAAVSFAIARHQQWSAVAAVTQSEDWVPH
jgi:hypothetical protein